MKIVNGKATNYLERFSLAINRYALWIILFYAAFSVLAVNYVVDNIGVNSNTADMFDASLEFREKQDHFNNLFPFENTFIVVVEGENPEETEIVARELYESFKNDSLLYEEIFLPGTDDFFKKNQLLFLDRTELERFNDRLSQSTVFLSIIAQNQSLRGLFSLLDLVMTRGNEEQIARLDNLYGQMSHVILARMQNENRTLSWQQVFGGGIEPVAGNLHILQISPKLDFNQLLPARPALVEARKNADRYLENDQVNVRISGKLAMSFEEMQSVTEGAILASILALIFVSLLLWIGLRSFKLILSSILTLIVGLSFTMAFATWAVEELNMISVAFAVLYIGLGIDYAIHFTLKYNGHVFDNQTLDKALTNTGYSVGPPLLIACLATTIGFYAFLPTSFEGVSELGLIAGTGMFICFLVTFTLLPALLQLLRFNRKKTSEITLVAPFASRVTTILNNKTTLIRATGIVAAIASVVLVPFLRFDYDPINLRDSNSESVATILDLMESDRLTPWNIEILSADSSQVRHLQQELGERESVGRTVSLLSFVPENQTEKMQLIRRIRSRLATVPEVRKDSASYLIDNQMEAITELVNRIEQSEVARSENLNELDNTLRSLLNELDNSPPSQQEQLVENIEKGLLKHFPTMLSNLRSSVHPEVITAESLPENLKRRWASENGIYRLQVTPAEHVKDNRELRSFASEIRQIAPDATGELITVIESGNIVIRSFIEALSYALIGIILVLLVCLKSFRDTFFVLLPLLLMSVMTGAVMVIMGLQFNFANIIALPLLLGLGAATAIHMIHRARDGSIANEDLLKTTTSRAIFFSSLTTLFSFGNLAFSPHSGTASLGFIFIIGVICLIFATLIVLPAFLISKKNPEDAETKKDVKELHQ